MEKVHQVNTQLCGYCLGHATGSHGLRKEGRAVGLTTLPEALSHLHETSQPEPWQDPQNPASVPAEGLREGDEQVGLGEKCVGCEPPL
jgi:hypothetical protein